MKNNFEILDLKTELTKNLSELGMITMTPVQEISLPFILKGRDVMAQAKTGSGKTAAFGLGILNKLEEKNSRVQSLILCPTRELAEQVAKELRMLARMMKNIKVLTITGGKAEYHQERSLAHGAHIVVGTPGRVLKLIENKILFLNTISSFILDEADKMLDMGFYDDILKIRDFIPQKHQTLLYSATFPESIKELGGEVQNKAETIEIDTDHSKESIEESFIKLESHKNKPSALLSVLSHYRPSRFIVFCKTKQISDTVAKNLSKQGIFAEAIHGDLDQAERTSALTRFSHRSISALIATDVASRGLDIKNLELVINYDLPTNPEVYIHRVGRTARAGSKGLAVNFYIEQEEDSFQNIIKEREVKSLSLAELKNTNPYDLVPPMTTIFISGGKRDKLRPGDIVGAIVGEAKIDAKDIGDISLLTVNTYVAIKRELAELVIDKLNKGRIKNRKFNVGFIR